MANETDNKALKGAEIDAGESLYEWEMWEFHPHERSKTWYAIAMVVVGLMLVYAVITSNFMFAIIILMISIIFLLNNLHKPKHIAVHLTDKGLVVDEEFHPYKDIKDFSVIYNPPVELLYVDFYQFWMPILKIPLHEADPNAVRSILLEFTYENLERDDEHLTDTVERMYKL